MPETAQLPVAPLARVPRSQVTVPPDRAVVGSGGAGQLVGRVSVTSTPSAGSGPLLVTVTVNVIVPPPAMVGGADLLTTRRRPDAGRRSTGAG